MKPYEECSRFNRCSVPKCPLDPDRNERVSYPEEGKCTMNKARRWEIGKKYPKLLKYEGLTGFEYNGHKKFNTLDVLDG